MKHEKETLERERKDSPMKKFLEEFKKFIMKGNALDLAVGVIIGGAFTSIVNSLNADIITPILAIFGGIDFSNLTVKLGTGDLAPVLTYGNFITAVINFLITAFVIFCMIKVINGVGDKFKKKKEEKTVIRILLSDSGSVSCSFSLYIL